MQQAPANSIQVEAGDGVRRLVLAGPVGLEQTADLHHAALEIAAAGGDLEIDWCGATHLGSAPLQVLLALREELAAQGCSLAVNEPSEETRRELAIAGAGPLFLQASKDNDSDA